MTPGRCVHPEKLCSRAAYQPPPVEQARSIAGVIMRALDRERARRAARIHRILLLTAVCPANPQVPLNAQAMVYPVWEQALLWLRLPLRPCSSWA